MSAADMLRRLDAGATPGPWRVAHHGTHEVESWGGALLADCGTIGSAHADARAIATLRTLLPKLVAVVEAAREGAGHHYGCMAIHGPPYGCECGCDDLVDALRALDEAAARLSTEVGGG